jgi:hypothetical protein
MGDGAARQRLAALHRAGGRLLPAESPRIAQPIMPRSRSVREQATQTLRWSALIGRARGRPVPAPPTVGSAGRPPAYTVRVTPSAAGRASRTARRRRWSARRLISTYVSVLRLAIARPRRSFGRRMPNASA